MHATALQIDTSPKVELDRIMGAILDGTAGPLARDCAALYLACCARVARVARLRGDNAAAHMYECAEDIIRSI